MRNTNHLVRSAPIAIAAVLALGTTPAMAQAVGEAAPVTTTSAPASSVAQPTMVMPVDVAPAPAPAAQQPRFVAAPTVQAVPEPAPEQTAQAASQTAPVAATVATSRKTAPTAQRAPSSSAAAAPMAAPAAPVAQPITDTNTLANSDALSGEPVAAEVEPLPLPVGSVADAPAAADAEGNGEWLSLVALALLGLIPIGVVALALIWWRRRSVRAQDMRSSSPLTAREIARRTPSPAPAREAPIFDHEPAIPVETAAVASTTPRRPETAPDFDPEPVPAPSMQAGVATLERPRVEQRATTPLSRSNFLPRDGKAILPDQVPESFEERDRLMRELVAQEPDAANPFRSGKARARRARLIIQSLGRKFENVTPRFDLSQYSYRWPHLNGANTAMA